MQTFLPVSCFKQSAAFLDDRRLGKQRVECLQILNTLAKGEYSIVEHPPEITLYKKKTPWYNHPAVQMWRGFESYLSIYGRIICKEWVHRGFKDTCYEKIFESGKLFKVSVDSPSWLGDEKFHSSHRSNLLRKNPTWYNKFGWSEPSNLPYVWPTKIGNLSA